LLERLFRLFRIKEQACHVDFLRSEAMRFFLRIVVCLVLGVFVVSIPATATPAPSGSRNSVVIVFKDGHKQSVDLAEVERIDFKTPSMIVFKDGHQQHIADSEISRIEFETSSAAPLGHNHFLGKWEVGQGNGSNFFITLEADGTARKTLGSSHGTWTFVDGEARISWDDGWHDVIRKVGSRHEKVAFEPGKSFSDPPANVTAATNTEPRPI
jgi:hypothetical protein